MLSRTLMQHRSTLSTLARALSSETISVRWAAFNNGEMHHPRKYLSPQTNTLEQYRNASATYQTLLRKNLLRRDFGDAVVEDFFSVKSRLNLQKLFTEGATSEAEQRQLEAINKEFKIIFSNMEKQYSFAIALHKGCPRELTKTLHRPSATDTINSIFRRLSEGYLIQNKKHLKNQCHELSIVSCCEFAYYPFLAPLSYKHLEEIKRNILIRCKNMPKGTVVVFGTTAFALTNDQASALGITQEQSETDFKVYNISLIVAHTRNITNNNEPQLFIMAKEHASNIDYHFPIFKHHMHDGAPYPPQSQSSYQSPSGLQETIPIKPPSLQSRKDTMNGYTEIPLANSLSNPTRSFDVLTTNNKTVRLILEICLEHKKAVSRKYHRETHRLDRCTTNPLHLLLAHQFGAEQIRNRNIVGDKLLFHDGSSDILVHNKRGIHPRFTNFMPQPFMRLFLPETYGKKFSFYKWGRASFTIFQDISIKTREQKEKASPPKSH